MLFKTKMPFYIKKRDNSHYLALDPLYEEVRHRKDFFNLKTYVFQEFLKFGIKKGLLYFVTFGDKTFAYRLNP